MNHQLTLKPELFDTTDTWLLSKNDPLFEKNDTLTLGKDGTREQKVRYIKAIHTDKVHTAYCYLELSYTMGEDDVKIAFPDDAKIWLDKYPSGSIQQNDGPDIVSKPITSLDSNK